MLIKLLSFKKLCQNGHYLNICIVSQEIIHFIKYGNEKVISTCIVNLREVSYSQGVYFGWDFT